MSFLFLTPTQGRQEYQATDYFDQMNWLELQYRLNLLGIRAASGGRGAEAKAQLVGFYTGTGGAVVEWTEQDQVVVRFYVVYLFNLLAKKAPQLVPNQRPIGLIK